MKNQVLIAFIIASVLASCTPVPTRITTEMPTSSSSPVVMPTSDTKVERWQEYENALAAVFLPVPFLPGKGLCEWEILGQSEDAVYVWALCQVSNSAGGAAMSAPAVIHLTENDNIEKVEIPRDGSQYAVDIRKMFPNKLQEKILSQSIDSLDEMWNHIQIRRNNPEPPLIVETGISLP